MQHTSKAVKVAIGVAVLALLLASVWLLVVRNEAPIDVDELWGMQYEGEELDGRSITVRGDAVFDPQSDFRFNALYLVDSLTPMERRSPADGFWFGIRIDGFTCQAGKRAGSLVCSPFDPSRARTFEFKGEIHTTQVGKRRVIWLSDIDFNRSRQLIEGSWLPIPLGEFEIITPAEE